MSQLTQVQQVIRLAESKKNEIPIDAIQITSTIRQIFEQLWSSNDNDDNNTNNTTSPNSSNKNNNNKWFCLPYPLRRSDTNDSNINKMINGVDEMRSVSQPINQSIKLSTIQEF